MRSAKAVFLKMSLLNIFQSIKGKERIRNATKGAISEVKRAKMKVKVAVWY